MKKNKSKKEFLEQLRKIPIVQVACEKTAISRNSAYRWRNEDEQFKKDWDMALVEGEALVNDMSESQLLTLIKEKNFHAISFWLRRRNPRFRDKLELTTHFEKRDDLTPEEERIVSEALRLATLPHDQPLTSHEHDTTNPTNALESDAQESENPNSDNP